MLSIILSVVLQAIRITFLIILFIYFFSVGLLSSLFFSFNFTLVVVTAAVVAEQVFELYLHVRQIQNTRYKTQNPQAACLSFCLYLFSFAFVFAVVVVVLVLALHTGELLKFYVNVHNYFKLNSKFVVCNETKSEKYVD